jgi:hypothetical protein
MKDTPALRWDERFGKIPPDHTPACFDPAAPASAPRRSWDVPSRHWPSPDMRRAWEILVEHDQLYVHGGRGPGRDVLCCTDPARHERLSREFGAAFADATRDRNNYESTAALVRLGKPYPLRGGYPSAADERGGRATVRHWCQYTGERYPEVAQIYDPLFVRVYSRRVEVNGEEMLTSAYLDPVPAGCCENPFRGWRYRFPPVQPEGCLTIFGRHLACPSRPVASSELVCLDVACSI